MSLVDIALPGQQPSLADRAYRDLRDRIVRLEFAPGSPLPEDQLMRWLGVGRTPLREAFRQLARDGLVVILPRRGTLVSEISFDHPLQIAQVREVTEALVARMVAERVTSEQRTAIAALRGKLKKITKTGSVDALLLLDAEIHRQIHFMADNPFLTSTLETHYNLALRIWYAAGQRAREPSYIQSEVASLDELLEAIQVGDGARAARLAGGHVIDSARYLMNSTDAPVRSEGFREDET
jgi:DNA-binding GntR family transcriptional regulator